MSKISRCISQAYLPHYLTLMFELPLYENCSFNQSIWWRSRGMIVILMTLYNLYSFSTIISQKSLLNKGL